MKEMIYLCLTWTKTNGHFVIRKLFKTQKYHLTKTNNRKTSKDVTLANPPNKIHSWRYCLRNPNCQTKNIVNNHFYLLFLDLSRNTLHCSSNRKWSIVLKLELRLIFLHMKHKLPSRFNNSKLYRNLIF